MLESTRDFGLEEETSRGLGIAWQRLLDQLEGYLAIQAWRRGPRRPHPGRRDQRPQDLIIRAVDGAVERDCPVGITELDAPGLGHRLL